MLSIRLRRTGRAKRPYYRVVVADSGAPRDGRFVEVLGHYDPRADPSAFEINGDRARYWIQRGARPSETVRSLLKRQLKDAGANQAAEETGAAAS